MARTPVLLKATAVGRLSAQERNRSRGRVGEGRLDGLKD
jgi:hypothetical protein